MKGTSGIADAGLLRGRTGEAALGPTKAPRKRADEGPPSREPLATALHWSPLRGRSARVVGS